MSEEKFKTVTEIDEADIQKASIAGLRTTPNRGGTYGANGLRPDELKAKFDELPILVKDKLHELIKAYNALVAGIGDGTLGSLIKVEGIELPQAITNAVATKSAVKVGGELKTEFDADAFGAALRSAIVDGAPVTLDTLAKLSAAIGNNPNFSKDIIENTKKAASASAESAAEKVLASKVDESALAEALTEKAEVLDVDILRKRVVNLEQGITPDPYLTDDSTAYVKTVPADALPYARLEAVGGMTHKEEGIRNLFKMDTIVSDYNDGSYYELKNADAERGSVTVRGTYTPQLTLAEVFPDIVEGKTYTLSLVCSYAESEEWEVWIGDAHINKASASKSANFTATRSVLASSISFNSGTVYEEFEMFPGEMEITQLMIVEGETVPDEFIPYGVTVGGEIRETKVTALDIVGKNLFDCANAVKYNGWSHIVSQNANGITVAVDNASRQYTSCNFILPDWLGGKKVTISAKFVASGSNKGEISIAWLKSNGLSFSGKDAYSTTSGASATGTIKAKPADDATLCLLLQSNTSGTAVVGDTVAYTEITVTLDTTATPFIPYHKSTFPIPAEVQALDGYGWGIPKGAHNGIEWDEDGNATYVQRVFKRVLKSGDFAHMSTSASHGVYFTKSLSPLGVSDNKGTTVLCNKFPSGIPQPYEKGVYLLGDATYTAAYIFAGEYAKTLDEWKAQLDVWEADGDPLTLYYEFATPIVTDISHLITRDNFIEVEGGGIIIAQNENADAAPITITYQLKEG